MMFRAEFRPYSGGNILKIEPEKRTLKTVTVNGRRENKIGKNHPMFGSHRWFEYREDAVDWLLELAKECVSSAENKLEDATMMVEAIRAMRD